METRWLTCLQVLCRNLLQHLHMTTECHVNPLYNLIFDKYRFKPDSSLQAYNSCCDYICHFSLVLNVLLQAQRSTDMKNRSGGRLDCLLRQRVEQVQVYLLFDPDLYVLYSVVLIN